MSVGNTGVPKLATNRRRILTKLKWVLDTWLRQSIDEYNQVNELTGDYAIQPPRQINLSINTMDVNQTDAYPCLNIIPVGATTNITEVLGVNTDNITYDIIAATVCDAVDVDFAARQNEALALIAADVVERYLPESPGTTTDGTTVYRVDQVSSTLGRPAQFQPGAFMTSHSARVQLWSRAQVGYVTSHLSASVSPLPGVQSNYTYSGTAQLVVDGTPIATTITPGLMTNIGVPSGSTSFVLRFTDTNITPNSDAYVTIQRNAATGTYLNLAFTGGDQDVTIIPMTSPITPVSPPQTGDVITVSIAVDGVNAFITFPIQLTVV
jgi:hypothetical protein